MRLEAQKYLFDVLEAINLVAEYCVDETYERYAVSSMLRAAVERQFITAGEALTQMPGSTRQRLSGFLMHARLCLSETCSFMVIRRLMISWSGRW